MSQETGFNKSRSEEILRAFVYTIILTLTAGCASLPPSEPMHDQLPAPSSFNATGTAKINVPPLAALQWGPPPTISATFHAEAHSEAISTGPLRSHHEGHMSLQVTDGTGKQAFADVNLTVGGDSIGTPTDGLEEVVVRFFDMASMFTRPATKPSPPGD